MHVNKTVISVVSLLSWLESVTFLEKTETIAQNIQFWNIDRAVTDHLKVIPVRYLKTSTAMKGDKNV